MFSFDYYEFKFNYFTISEIYDHVLDKYNITFSFLLSIYTIYHGLIGVINKF